ncbi:MAG: MATE family efflux transporter [Lachnospiraceae bacterium]|nr:MATE family efflux transporter [Lachnospiraceae bacterium]
MSEIRENKMGTEPVPQLLLSMALPMMFSMLVQATYNVVDSIFVSRINEAALTAVSMAFPIQNLMIAVATGTGVGINALLSRSLGEKNQKTADEAANMGVFLAVMSYILFLIIGLTVPEIFMRAQTPYEDIIAYGVEYTRIVTVFSFGIFGEIVLERLMQATGKTFLSMIVQLVGAGINLIFDPILIFGLLGFPAMGVTGAAIATVGGQIVGMIVGIFLNHFLNTEIRLSVKEIFRPKLQIIARIYSVGVPSILMASIGSVMTFCMNKILMGFSSTATAVFGIYFKIQSFFFMPMFGINNGMVPIVAYNYGARKKQRIMDAVKYAQIYATIILFFGLVLFEGFPGWVLSLFNASDHMLEIGVPALRIICTSYVFASYCIVTGSFFQALGNGVYTLIMSAARQLLVLVPAAYLLSLSGNLLLVWLAYPLAEIASVSMCMFLKRRIIREKLTF